MAGMLGAETGQALEKEATVAQYNLLDILASGGVMMIPLGLMSVVTVLMIFLFLLTIRRNAVVSDRFMDQADALIRKRDLAAVSNLCQRSSESIARITQKALDFMDGNPSASFSHVRDVAQSEGSRQSSLLVSRVSYLADIGAIAPMVGLLGTVIGMIKAFLEISQGEGTGVRQMGMAEGVSEALIATAGGLCISIPAFIFYAFFRSRVHKYIAELEAAATHLLAVLHAQNERPQVPQAPYYVPQPGAPVRGREDYAMPVASPLSGNRPDLHGI